MIKKKENQDDESSLVVYNDMGGNKVKLSLGIIKRFISSNVSDKEAMNFLMLCKSRNLNPFTGQAFLIKYDDNPATIVVGKEAFMERAAKNPDYNGMKAGVIIEAEDGILYREGCFYMQDKENIVGGWAEAYRKSWEHPIRTEVPIDEYIGKKKTGEINKQWLKMPATMIRKVAIVQALREAFPSDLGGMYDAAESEKFTGMDISKIVEEKEKTHIETPPEKKIKTLSDLLETYKISQDWLISEIRKKGMHINSIGELDDPTAQAIIEGIKKMGTEDIQKAQVYRKETKGKNKIGKKEKNEVEKVDEEVVINWR